MKLHWHHCISKCVCARTDQVDGSLVEGGCLQNLLHGDCLQFVRVQLFTLVRYAVVHDHRQRADPRLLIVRPSFLKDETQSGVFICTLKKTNWSRKI